MKADLRQSRDYYQLLTDKLELIFSGKFRRMKRDRCHTRGSRSEYKYLVNH
jgi:hypothetical protein